MGGLERDERNLTLKSVERIADRAATRRLLTRRTKLEASHFKHTASDATPKPPQPCTGSAQARPAGSADLAELAQELARTGR